MAKILYAEDEAIARDSIGPIMERWGYDVALTCDGDEALEKTEHEEFDLILT